MALVGRRKKPVKACPNPLFIKWLTEWKDEAESNGWKSAYTYKMAISSLKKYPLTLNTGKECKILMHFGDKICSMLEKKLNEHLSSGLSEEFEVRDETYFSVNPDDNQISDGVSESAAASRTVSKSKDPVTSGHKVSSRRYVPAYRSGAYSLLVTLYKFTQVENRGSSLTKGDLIKLAQPLCDKSLTVPDKGTYYTGFSSMSTLIKKGLIEKRSSPARYYLTDDGISLAQTLATAPAAETQPGYSDRQSSSDAAASLVLSAPHPLMPANMEPAQTSSRRIGAPFTLPSILSDPVQQAVTIKNTTPAFDVQSVTTAESKDDEALPAYTLTPGSYDVILVVDNREHYGFGRAKQHILPGLLKNGVQFELRPITVGDFIWIARSKHDKDVEAVLDFIVERKRLDDLSGSIVDGRYKEQKLRMKASGLRKPVYLVEFYKGQKNEKIKEEALLQAVVNTQVIDGFYVKRCQEINDCIAYISILHHQIQSLYQCTGKIRDLFKVLGFSSSHQGSRRLLQMAGLTMLQFCQVVLFHNSNEAVLEQDTGHIDLPQNKTIHVYGEQTLPDLPFDSQAAEMSHLTYNEFLAGGAKTKPPSLQECWSRFLMVIPGVSLDKSEAIADAYPTLVSLMHAYDSCASELERRKLLANLVFGSNRRSYVSITSGNDHLNCHQQNELTFSLHRLFILSDMDYDWLVWHYKHLDMRVFIGFVAAGALAGAAMHAVYYGYHRSVSSKVQYSTSECNSMDETSPGGVSKSASTTELVKDLSAHLIAMLCFMGVFRRLQKIFRRRGSKANLVASEATNRRKSVTWHMNTAEDARDLQTSCSLEGEMDCLHDRNGALDDRDCSVPHSMPSYGVKLAIRQMLTQLHTERRLYTQADCIVREALRGLNLDDAGNTSVVCQESQHLLANKIISKALTELYESDFLLSHHWENGLLIT